MVDESSRQEIKNKKVEKGKDRRIVIRREGRGRTEKQHFTKFNHAQKNPSHVGRRRSKEVSAGIGTQRRDDKE